MVFPMALAGGLAMGGLNLLGSLFGSKKKGIKLPPAVKAEIAKLQYVPFGPERDAMVQNITSTYDISKNKFDQSLKDLGGRLDTSEANNQGVMDASKGLSRQFEVNAGNNPYMQLYGNPGAREQQMLGQLQAANAAAFDVYGAQGAESQLRQGLLSADAARKGMVNSGIARRQMEQEKMRMAQARAEADNKAISAVRQQGVAEGQIYNQGAGIANQNLMSSLQAQNQIANVNQQNVNNRFDESKLYGNSAFQTSNQLLGAQSELRGSQQEVENYNTQTQNKVNQDYAAAQNQRNMAQAGYDASAAAARPNIFQSLSGALGAGLSAYSGMGGGFGGGGSRGGCKSGGCYGASSGGGGSSWSPEMPSSNYASYSKYGKGGF